jgi:UDP-galactopyranose mutase
MDFPTNKTYDFLIVGTGLFGATFARLATDAGYKCLVIDRRPHTGGNTYCQDISGICVHMYGPHVFHTKSEDVWRFVNKYATFNRFTLSPIANYHGQLYNLPFNMNTFRQMWGAITPQQAMAIIDSQRYHGTPRNLEEQALALVGNDIYEQLIKGYTEKQWGRSCRDLPPDIIKRLPLRYTFDNNYFDDPYQGIPVDGYNSIIGKLLQGSEVMTGCDFFDGLVNDWRHTAHTLVYTGMIDQFYQYRYGHLQYRSLRFETETLQTPNYQGVAQMNFTDANTPYTRIIEHKHFTSFGQQVYDNPNTVITHEYSQPYTPGAEPYYPINDQTNCSLYAKYKILADQEPDTIFGGRLAEYRYYNMDQAIASAMRKWKRIPKLLKHC